MSIREIDSKPEVMCHFPDTVYRWLEMHDHGSVYGYAAVAERGDALELHVTLQHWGVKVRRNITEDVTWLKAEAKRLGKQRIMGIRANTRGDFDPNLFKFARLYGFTDICVFQTASLQIE